MRKQNDAHIQLMPFQFAGGRTAITMQIRAAMIKILCMGIGVSLNEKPTRNNFVPVANLAVRLC